jgi:hypothetical protein
MTIEKWISLAVAAAVCVFAIYLRGATMLVYAIGFMVLPLVAIWYSEEVASWSSGWRLNRPTPGIAIKVAGWLLLAVTPLAVYAFHLRLAFTR